ncbi:MAG: hypothetical protein KAJ19_14200 [Gammaproteobacteria bacterium]|nr:hypothetical protein [Gammaproteobacteria bacterium]
MNLKLDLNTHDLDLTNNAASLVDGLDAIHQDWICRLKFIRGEWFLDQRAGIPYFEEVFVKQPNPARLRAIFYEATLTTPGIAEIKAFSLDLSADRILTIDVDAVTDGGESIKLEYSEMVLSQPGAA